MRYGACLCIYLYLSLFSNVWFCLCRLISIWWLKTWVFHGHRVRLQPEGKGLQTRLQRVDQLAYWYVIICSRSILSIMERETVLIDDVVLWRVHYFVLTCVQLQNTTQKLGHEWVYYLILLLSRKFLCGRKRNTLFPFEYILERHR